jgi:hypothetical protein
MQKPVKAAPSCTIGDFRCGSAAGADRWYKYQVCEASDPMIGGGAQWGNYRGTWDDTKCAAPGPICDTAGYTAPCGQYACSEKQARTCQTGYYEKIWGSCADNSMCAGRRNGCQGQCYGDAQGLYSDGTICWGKDLAACLTCADGNWVQSFACGAKPTNGKSTTQGNTASEETCPWCAGADQCYQSGGTWGGAESYCQTAKSGNKCCRVSGGGGGAAAGPTATPVPTANCGDGCAVSRDCKQYVQGNGNVQCINGRCANRLCPTSTIPGTICGCDNSKATIACGQPCAGGCAAGTICTFMDGTCQNGSTARCIAVKGPNPINPNADYQTADPNFIGKLCSKGAWALGPAAYTGKDGYKIVSWAKGGHPTAAEINSACNGVVATPAPTPKPVQCVGITMDNKLPKLNDQVTFTCATVQPFGGQLGAVQGGPSIMPRAPVVYEFRYRILPYDVNRRAYQGQAALSNWTAITALNSTNISTPLSVKAYGAYQVQCRPCLGSFCDIWENIPAPAINSFGSSMGGR